MTDRELMQMALETLEEVQMTITTTNWLNKRVETLRARLSQCDRCGKVNPAEIHTCTPMQCEPVRNPYRLHEPVAWLDSLDRSQPHAVTGFQYLTVSQIERGDQYKYIPVYAAPLHKEWVGLTDEDIKFVANSCRWSADYHTVFSRAIEAKLKERNT